MPVTITRGPPGFVYYREEFIPLVTPRLVEAIKEEPGAAWDKEARRWRIPVEELDRVLGFRNGLGKAQLVDPDGVGIRRYQEVDLGGCRLLDPTNPLRPYQKDGVKLARSAGIALLSFGVGLGKTLAAIKAFDGQAPRIVVVCPPKAVDVWHAELEKWSPDSAFDVWNYNKLDGFSSLTPPGAFIFDEIHHFKNYDSLRTKRAYELRKKYPLAPAIGLTATPTADNPIDLWMPFELLRPGGFGSFWKFRERYFWLAERTVGFGESEKSFTEVAGLHPLYGEQLRRRISALSVRATRQQWSQYLPPITIRKTLGLSASGALEFVRDSVGENGPALVMVIHRERAHDLGQQLGMPVVTGEMPLSERVTFLRGVAGNGGSAVVTMGAIGEAIDLTAFTHGFVLEIPDYPVVLTQAIGRIHRSNGKAGVLLDFVVPNQDVGKLAVVEAKLYENQQVVDGDSFEEGLTAKETDVSDSLRAMMEE